MTRHATPLALFVALAALAASLAGCNALAALWSDEPEPIPVTAPETVDEELAGPVVAAHDEPEPLVEMAPPTRPADEPNTPVDEGADPNGVIGIVPADPNAGPQEVVAASLLRVRGEFITTDDVVLAAGPLLTNLPANLPEHAFRARAAEILQNEIRRQVNQLTVLGEVEKTIQEPQHQFIDAQVDDLLQRLIDEHGRSRQQLEADMIAEGTTLQTVLDNYRRDVKLQLYWQTKLKSAVVINRRDLWNHYQKNLDSFSSPKKVQMQLIALPFSAFTTSGSPSPGQQALAKGQAYEMARQAQALIRDGKDFGDVAKEMSRGVMAKDGGTWPLMGAGNFAIKPVEQAAFSLTQGQVSDIIETEQGYYVVKALQVMGGTVTPFEQAQEEIETQLRNQRERELIEQFMQRVYLNTPVMHTERFLELAVDEAWRRFRQ